MPYDTNVSAVHATIYLLLIFARMQLQYLEYSPYLTWPQACAADGLFILRRYIRIIFVCQLRVAYPPSNVFMKS